MHLRTWMLALGAATTVSCGGTPPRIDLTVTAFSPTAPIDRPAPIEVRFDQPVVEADQVGRPVDPGTVAITPAVPWQGHWQDRQTIAIETSGALRPGTTYHVRLAGELAARSGDFGFTFVHQPLVLEGVAGDSQAIDPAGPVVVSFNLPVRAADVARRCALTGDGARVGLTTDATTTDRSARVTPAQPLARNAEYTLSCPDLTAAGGDAPIDAGQALVLQVRPPLEVGEITPDGADVPSDAVEIEIALTTEVALDAIRAAVTSTPAIPGLADGELDGSGTVYRVYADLESDVAYTITVGALVDLHGEALAAPVTHTFHTGDATPRLSMERGLYALEASAAGYPIWTRNLDSYEVTCAAIPKPQLTKLLTTQMDYAPWGGYDDATAIDWKALGAEPTVAKRALATEKNRWARSDLDLGATCGAASGARGVYLADVVSSDGGRNRVMVNVTDLGVLLKVGPSSGLVWVTSLATGEPVAGAKVAVATPEGKTVFTGKSDANGLVTMPGSAELLGLTPPAPTDDDGEGEEDWDYDSYRAQRLIATVTKGDDLAVVDGNWANGIQIWNFGLPEERRGGVTQIRALIQSDRGLYKPGETVHFKGIARELAAGAAPKVPRRKPVHVEVSDSRGATAYSGDVAMSKFGGFGFDLPLDASSPLGDWYVQATVGGQTFHERFLVQEFRPATYELALRGGDEARLGEPLALDLDAQYLFGAPVADATTTWSVSRRAHWVRFAGWDEYTFEDNGDRMWWWDDARDDYGDFVGDGQAVTDARGHVAIDVRDPDTSLRGPQDYLVTATVTDEADQTLETARVITAHQTDVYLGLHTNECVQAAGMPFAVNAIAVTPDGTRRAAKARLTFTRKVSTCTWHDVAGRSYSSCTSKDELAIDREVEIPETGQLTERIYPTAPGDYLVKLEGTDGRGQPVVASSMVWVIGKGDAFWSGDESARMTLIASKARYEVGDTARLVAQANLVKPVALVTIERDGVISAEVRHLDSAAEGLELTIADAWAPDVFASVAMVSGRHGDGDRDRPQFKMGVVELRVDASPHRLDVAVQLDEASVRPGAPVHGKVVVTSHGKPVKAELSLSVADEGVLSLIAYRTPDPMAAFYAAWGLGVDTGTNWNRLARSADPDAGDPDAGGDYGGSDGPAVRSRFVASAYWAPALVTDDRGVAEFAFTAPDNLTAFRVMAVAADTGARFGSGDARLTIAKPLMAIPVLPRFLGADDTLAVGVVIHDHTGQAGKATVTITAQGATVATDTQEIDVPADGSARVRFAVTTSSADAAATFGFVVKRNGEQDALAVTVPIRKPRVRDTATVAEDAGTGRRHVLDLPVAAATIRGESELVITADRTGLGDVEPSLRYLVEYPYGCLEQTMSKFVPLAKAKDLSGSLGIDGLSRTKMDEYLKAGVAKVAHHQHEDGHFSLWPDSTTYPHLTALAMWGLTEAEKAGVTVPQDTLDRGAAALTAWLDDAATIDGDNHGATAAMAAWVLAVRGQPHAGAVARLYELRASLPRWGQAFLVRALIAGKAKKALITEAMAALVAAVTDDGQTAHVVETTTSDDDHFMTSDARATAMVLAALVEASPDHPLIPKLVAGLKEARRRDGRWESTEDNLWALVALADYARGAAKGSGKIVIDAGGTRLARHTVKGGGVVVVRTKLDALTADQLTIDADDGVHWTARLTQVSPDDGAAQSTGFGITREYLDASGAPVTTVKAGDLVTVQLAVIVGADTEWVALVDPLPAGLEAVNPALAGSSDTTVGWDHTELRDDRVQWFADHLDQGWMVMSYKARATIDGTFAAPPATIEAMYDSSIRGRTASAVLTVQP